MTREEVDPEVMIFNKNIKQATSDYLMKNPWSFEFVPCEKLANIWM